ncbi:TSUP family transporter [Flavobacterium sp. RSB2_4_14]|uniref:TSUP family transporter n=1 Tax=Flavobacterium sp. RSB2_4_14 TaxID=3447665 RepID=UPI003F3352E2
MDYVVICIVALVGSALTLFSGFGLGTLLLPVFGLFFPIEIAIVLTSIVHFLNNFFKLFLFGKKANKNVILVFGIPAILFAYVGAYSLKLLTTMEPIFQYTISEQTFTVMPVKLMVGILLMLFALIEFIPKYKNISFDKKYLPIGGILSGFFGGISGHQGALRSAFLIRANLSKEAFIATGVVIACLVDVSRLSVYFPQIIENKINLDYTLLIFATLSAFSGVYFGNKLLQKTTFKAVQNLVAIMLLLYSLLLTIGVL